MKKFWKVCNENIYLESETYMAMNNLYNPI